MFVSHNPSAPFASDSPLEGQPIIVQSADTDAPVLNLNNNSTPTINSVDSFRNVSLVLKGLSREEVVSALKNNKISVLSALRCLSDHQFQALFASDLPLVCCLVTHLSQKELANIPISNNDLCLFERALRAYFTAEKSGAAKFNDLVTLNDYNIQVLIREIFASSDLVLVERFLTLWRELLQCNQELALPLFRNYGFHYFLPLFSEPTHSSVVNLALQSLSLSENCLKKYCILPPSEERSNAVNSLDARNCHITCYPELLSAIDNCVPKDHCLVTALSLLSLLDWKKVPDQYQNYSNSYLSLVHKVLTVIAQAQEEIVKNSIPPSKNRLRADRLIQQLEKFIDPKQLLQETVALLQQGIDSYQEAAKVQRPAIELSIQKSAWAPDEAKAIIHYIGTYDALPIPLHKFRVLVQFFLQHNICDLQMGKILLNALVKIHFKEESPGLNEFEFEWLYRWSFLNPTVLLDFDISSHELLTMLLPSVLVPEFEKKALQAIALFARACIGIDYSFTFSDTSYAEDFFAIIDKHIKHLPSKNDSEAQLTWCGAVTMAAGFNSYHGTLLKIDGNDLFLLSKLANDLRAKGQAISPLIFNRFSEAVTKSFWYAGLLQSDTLIASTIVQRWMLYLPKNIIDLTKILVEKSSQFTPQVIIDWISVDRLISESVTQLPNPSQLKEGMEQFLSGYLFHAERPVLKNTSDSQTIVQIPSASLQQDAIVSQTEIFQWALTRSELEDYFFSNLHSDSPYSLQLIKLAYMLLKTGSKAEQDRFATNLVVTYGLKFFEFLKGQLTLPTKKESIWDTNLLSVIASSEAITNIPQELRTIKWFDFIDSCTELQGWVNVWPISCSVARRIEVINVCSKLSSFDLTEKSVYGKYEFLMPEIFSSVHSLSPQQAITLAKLLNSWKTTSFQHLQIGFLTQLLWAPNEKVWNRSSFAFDHEAFIDNILLCLNNHDIFFEEWHFGGLALIVFVVLIMSKSQNSQQIPDKLAPVIAKIPLSSIMKNFLDDLKKREWLCHTKFSSISTEQSLKIIQAYVSLLRLKKKEIGPDDKDKFMGLLSFVHKVSKELKIDSISYYQKIEDLINHITTEQRIFVKKTTEIYQLRLEGIEKIEKHCAKVNTIFCNVRINTRKALDVSQYIDADTKLEAFDKQMELITKDFLHENKKTKFAKLICRLLDPTSCSDQWADSKIADCRSQFASVDFQNSKNLLENLTEELINDINNKAFEFYSQWIAESLSEKKHELLIPLERIKQTAESYGNSIRAFPLNSKEDFLEQIAEGRILNIQQFEETLEGKAEKYKFLVKDLLSDTKSTESQKIIEKNKKIKELRSDKKQLAKQNQALLQEVQSLQQKVQTMAPLKSDLDDHEFFASVTKEIETLLIKIYRIRNGDWPETWSKEYVAEWKELLAKWSNLKSYFSEGVTNLRNWTDTEIITLIGFAAYEFNRQKGTSHRVYCHRLFKNMDTDIVIPIHTTSLSQGVVKDCFLKLQEVLKLWVQAFGI